MTESDDPSSRRSSLGTLEEGAAQRAAQLRSLAFGLQFEARLRPGVRRGTEGVTDHGTGKICSLLPSATEIVYALGLGDRLVGVTQECDYPPAARQLPIVTRSVLGHEIRDSRDIH